MKRLIFILAICCLLFVSCIKDVDFDQVDDIEIYTDHITSLVYFDLDATDFLDEFDSEALFLSDTVRIPLFYGPYNENYLIQTDFMFRLTNTFSRSITIQFKLLDVNDNSLYHFQPIHSAPFSSDLETIEKIVESDIPRVLQTDKIVVNMLMASGSNLLDPLQNEKIQVESAIVLHYKVTVENE